MKRLQIIGITAAAIVSLSAGNEWARFEANGNFYFGSLQDPNTPYGRGSYKLGKNSISLLFDGERSKARIVKKGKNGHVDAFKYDGVVYASRLCP
jgi:hypothetical protein